MGVVRKETLARVDRGPWLNVDSVTYITGLNTNGTWITDTVTSNGSQWQVRVTDGMTVLRELSSSEELLQSFAIPNDKVVIIDIS